MAEHVASPLHLQWLRLANGSFSIGVVLVMKDLDDKLRLVPIRSWVLTKDEEKNLQQTINSGLVIAASLPPANGKDQESG